MFFSKCHFLLFQDDSRQAVRSSASIIIPSPHASDSSIARPTTITSNGHSRSMDFQSSPHPQKCELLRPIALKNGTHVYETSSSSLATIASVRSSASLEFDDDAKPSGVLVDDDFLPMSSPVDEHFWDTTPFHDAISTATARTKSSHRQQLNQCFPNVGSSPDIEKKQFTLPPFHTLSLDQPLSETSCDEEEETLLNQQQFSIHHYHLKELQKPMVIHRSALNPSMHSSERANLPPHNESIAVPIKRLCRSMSLERGKKKFAVFSRFQLWIAFSKMNLSSKNSPRRRVKRCRSQFVLPRYVRPAVMTSSCPLKQSMKRTILKRVLPTRTARMKVLITVKSILCVNLNSRRRKKRITSINSGIAKIEISSSFKKRIFSPHRWRPQLYIDRSHHPSWKSPTIDRSIASMRSHRRHQPRPYGRKYDSTSILSTNANANGTKSTNCWGTVSSGRMNSKCKAETNKALTHLFYLVNIRPMIHAQFVTGYSLSSLSLSLNRKQLIFCSGFCCTHSAFSLQSDPRQMIIVWLFVWASPLSSALFLWCSATT